MCCEMQEPRSARHLESANCVEVEPIDDESVGLLVAKEPRRAAVLESFAIDYCCGGKFTLATACEKAGVSIALVKKAMAELPPLQGEAEPNWLQADLKELACHIENTHHVFLKKELPRLRLLSEKVAAVHGSKDERLIEVREVFAAMKEELEAHTLKEERVLFPYICALASARAPIPVPFGSVANPVRCMEAEHDEAGNALARLRELTDSFQAPASACASWTALLAGFAALEQDLHRHIHKENSILFPRAVVAEEALMRNAVH
ncbi:MAG: iron-sulfur cluster repair di-iron protein [Candidatus Melainabacteria bacterium]|nr:iron-sulfur cluster repair di-iron protein [Candidatus Melainabacteria bacterium]